MGDVIDLSKRKRLNPRSEYDVVRADPLGEGEREVAVRKTPPPPSWRIETNPAGMATYVSDELDVIVTFMESTDDRGRDWQHLFLNVAWPVNHDETVEVMSYFLPARCCIVEPPRKTEPHRGVIAIHHCVTDPDTEMPAKKN